MSTMMCLVRGTSTLDEPGEVLQRVSDGQLFSHDWDHEVCISKSLSSSSFINALRRFIAVRGPVRLLRSDPGTNFIGACKEFKINAEEFKSYLQDQGCTWIFNSPHSSHIGGVWERLIGVANQTCRLEMFFF